MEELSKLDLSHPDIQVRLALHACSCHLGLGCLLTYWPGGRAGQKHPAMVACTAHVSIYSHLPRPAGVP